jgi:TolB-like protein
MNSRNPMNFLLFVLCLLVFAVSPCYAAQKDFKAKIALFPFENLSEDKDALKSVMTVLKNRLEAKGLEVLDDASLNRFLLKERIRCTGYISTDMARKIREEEEVEAILVGSINSFSNGENPQVGLSARLVDSSDGIILWADHVSATGDDFTTLLGLGTVKSLDRLILKAIDKLLALFSTIPPDKEIESTYKIAVMPFQNNSKVRDAGKITTYMFIAELFKSRKFVPVEYGDVRRLIVNFRVRDKGELNLKSMDALSGSLGIDGILVGTVELYNEGAGTAPPEAAISARLLDARKDRILWYDSYQLNGDDGIILLDWGKIGSAENVAYKAVSKLVKEMGKTKWH